MDSIALANNLLTEPANRAAIVAQAEGFTASELAEETDEATNELERINELKGEIEAINLPIGWQEMPEGVGGWVYKIVGLLITIIAVSQGAPFWFDIVNRLVNVRMAGRKPE